MKIPVPFVVGQYYVVSQRIGSGSFGEVFLIIDNRQKKRLAAKFELNNSKSPQLYYEYRICKLLKGGVGIPSVYWFGREKQFNIMIMDLLGPSLEDLLEFCSRKFTLKTVLMVADKTLARIEYVHSKNFIHRDIKPENFLIGQGKRKMNEIYLIDFGLAKKYRNASHKHIPYIEYKALTGTPRYASINTHIGCEQSRRDDLESLGFVLMYFNLGALPWQGIKARSKKEKYDKIKKKKIATSIDLLCESVPLAFAKYMKYCRKLHFTDKPDYAYLRRLFRSLFFEEGFAAGHLRLSSATCGFDWTILLQGKKSKKRRSGGKGTRWSIKVDEIRKERNRRTSNLERSKWKRNKRISNVEPSDVKRGKMDESGEECKIQRVPKNTNRWSLLRQGSPEKIKELKSDKNKLSIMRKGSLEKILVIKSPKRTLPVPRQRALDEKPHRQKFGCLGEYPHPNLETNEFKKKVVRLEEKAPEYSEQRELEKSDTSAEPQITLKEKNINLE